MTKRTEDSASDTAEIALKEDALLGRFVERLSNEAVVEKLRLVLNRKERTDKLDTLTEKSPSLTNDWIRMTSILLL